MTYCFKCPECGEKTERVAQMVGQKFRPKCSQGHVMKRDYQAESTNVNVEGLH